MKTEAQIRIQGMTALIDALGLVEAEQFIAAVSKDKLDYTQWRRQGLSNQWMRSMLHVQSRPKPNTF